MIARGLMHVPERVARNVTPTSGTRCPTCHDVTNGRPSADGRRHRRRPVARKATAATTELHRANEQYLPAGRRDHTRCALLSLPDGARLPHDASRPEMDSG